MKQEQKNKESPEVRYRRIRMKYGDKNLAKDAWKRNEVGIWYGAWSADDWARSLKRPDQQFQYLKNLPQPKGRGKFRKSDFDTARRFVDIMKNDWVVVFFDNALHLGHVRGGLRSSQKHPMNRNGEIFKYRKIVDKKSFLLGQLPDSYLLISAAGWGNVHGFNEALRAQIKFLAENRDEKSVTRAIMTLPITQWLELLGPTAWESLCLGYLIIKEGFLPTGLGIGRTLPTFDIVGRNKGGIRILAQCKKNPEPLRMPAEFINACKDLKGADIYFFAYGGVIGNPEGVTVVNRDDIQKWIDTRKGRNYIALWRS